MKRVVDVVKNRGRDLVWTYVIHLGNAEFHPAQLDFEIEALRLSQLDKLGLISNLSARMRIPI